MACLSQHSAAQLAIAVTARVGRHRRDSLGKYSTARLGAKAAARKWLAGLRQHRGCAVLRGRSQQVPQAASLCLLAAPMQAAFRACQV